MMNLSSSRLRTKKPRTELRKPILNGIFDWTPIVNPYITPRLAPMIHQSPRLSRKVLGPRETPVGESRLKGPIFLLGVNTLPEVDRPPYTPYRIASIPIHEPLNGLLVLRGLTEMNVKARRSSQVRHLPGDQGGLHGGTTCRSSLMLRRSFSEENDSFKGRMSTKDTEDALLREMKPTVTQAPQTPPKPEESAKGRLVTSIADYKSTNTSDAKTVPVIDRTDIQAKEINSSSNSTMKDSVVCSKVAGGPIGRQKTRLTIDVYLPRVDAVTSTPDSDAEE